MKKLLSVLLVLLVAPLSMSCTLEMQNDIGVAETDATESYSFRVDPTEFQDESHISVDCDNQMCIFDNGDIAFSWEINEWSYEFINGIPVLTRMYDGKRYSFAVLAYKKGTANSLSQYACEAVQNFFDVDDASCCMTAGGVDSRFNEKGYLCEKTGFAFLDYWGEDDGIPNRVGVVFAISNTKYSAVLSVYATGINENMEKLLKDNYAGNRDNGIITECAESILDSFEFDK